MILEPQDLSEEISEMFAELSGGWPGDIAAKQLGLRNEDLRHVCLSGKPTRGGSRPHPPHPRRAEAMRMLAEGVPLKRIPKMIAVSRASLHRWRKENR